MAETPKPAGSNRFRDAGFRAVPGAIVHLPAPPWSAIVAYVMALGLALTWWRLRTERTSCGCPSALNS